MLCADVMEDGDAHKLGAAERIGLKVDNVFPLRGQVS